MRQEFRVDINGLRAWAVLAVVLYHFGVSGISGGFVGVDVFFVISGFLMYGIIRTGLEKGDFSIWQFYLARARRIFPALAVLCAVALVAGWFFLMPKEYEQLGRHVRESLLFSSNTRYFDEAGYFDVASKEKWLLHTWSLSVEWQFYLLLPVLMLVVWKLRPRQVAISALVLSVFVASLAYCIWRTPDAPSEAFFLLHTRAWEMLAGALVYQWGARIHWQAWQQKICEWLGLALIIASIVIFDSSTVWPGWRALIPVLGAVLVLLAARQNSLWTASFPAQWLGTRSYSIYLWHWPLVVALAYLDLSESPLWVAGAIVASLVLGDLSYRWVENPTRRLLGKMSRVKSAVLLLAVLVLLAGLAQTVRRSGFPDRLPADIAIIEAERNNMNPRLRECLKWDAQCVYGPEPVRLLLVGDSHADAVVTAVLASLDSGGVLFKGASGCPVVFGMHSAKDRKDCEQFNALLEKQHEQLAPGVPMLVVGRTTEHIEGAQVGAKAARFYFSQEEAHISQAFLDEFASHYVDTLCRFAKVRPVYVMRPTPEMSLDVPTRVGRAMLLGREQPVGLPLAEYQKRHAFVSALQDQAAAQCGVKVLDPTPYLCDSQQCSAMRDGRPIYRDFDHFSEFGNQALIPLFKTIQTQP